MHADLDYPGKMIEWIQRTPQEQSKLMETKDAALGAMLAATVIMDLSKVPWPGETTESLAK